MVRINNMYLNIIAVSDLLMQLDFNCEFNFVWHANTILFLSIAVSYLFCIVISLFESRYMILIGPNVTLYNNALKRDIKAKLF